MRVIFKFILLTSSFLFLSACEDVVQIKLDEGSKLYVIDAFVNNLRTPQTIRVVTNDTYFSNREAPPVTGAVVVLNDLTANTQYNFNYVSNGNYVYNLLPGDTISRINHQYQLNVTIDGYTYTSLTTQKRTAVIDSISSVLRDGSGGFGPPPKDSTYRCYLFAKDKADDNADYYWIKTFRNDTLFSGSNDININIDGTGGAVVGAGVDTIDFTPPSTFLSFKQYRKKDTVKVEIHSISRENYFFFVQAQNQINNGGLFATTPENVKTNITTPKGAKIKATGRFNMASVVAMKKGVK
jgi:hypothetical protein